MSRLQVAATVFKLALLAVALPQTSQWVAAAQSSELASPPASQPTTDVDRGKDGPLYTPPFYVYTASDHPVFDPSDVVKCFVDGAGVAPWEDEFAATPVALNMDELWLLQTLLRHPSRVLDPADAQLFYIPLFTYLGVASRRIKEVATVCNGLTDEQRRASALEYLQTRSFYFRRFGGADHVLACTWWGCTHRQGERALISLARVAVATHEPILDFHTWQCQNRFVIVPYVANAAITAAGGLSGAKPRAMAAAAGAAERERRPQEEEEGGQGESRERGEGEGEGEKVRDIPFFFVGSPRMRPEREHLESVVTELYPDSVIQTGKDATDWTMNATTYAEHMVRARFCFAPRGDTLSSRRIFDAVAAGCIPVLTEVEERVLPFRRAGLNYSEFAIVAGPQTLTHEEQLRTLVRDLGKRTDAELAPLWRRLAEVKTVLGYGDNTGPGWGDMRPYEGVATMFLQETWLAVRGEDRDNLWRCPIPTYHAPTMLPRADVKMPPPAEDRGEWLAWSETVVSESHCLLVCAIPNTGAEPFKMLVKRLQGVEGWDSREPGSLSPGHGSGLPLLKTKNGKLMIDIYKNMGWVKIAVVRDPVTRLLAAYRQLRRRDPDKRAFKDAPGGVLDRFPRFVAFLDEKYGPDTMDEAPVPFRTMAGRCGMRHAVFDGVVPFETLRETGTEVLKSLPGGLWEEYGASGWGPGGEHAFLYGGDDTAWDGGTAGLFETCAWTQYYDQDALELVGRLYGEDYAAFGWYSLQGWRDKYAQCTGLPVDGPEIHGHLLPDSIP